MINYSQVPYGFTLCLEEKCSKGNTCLRQMAWQSVPAEVEKFEIVSPKYIDVLSGDCAYYCSSEKIRYARGFIKLLSNLPYKQMRVVISQLTKFFGQTTYYRVRKGERLLPPAEQKEVLNIIKSCGIDQSLEFDTYIEAYRWEPLLL